VTGTVCKVFSGSANRALAEEICRNLSLPLGESSLGHFSDGEIYFQINETCAAPTSSWCSPPAIQWTPT
jgi:phosphoribosylpyrophosphate synthetase